MEKVSHTAGPWSVLDRRAAALKNIRIVAACGHTVGEVADVHQRDDRAPDFDGSPGAHRAADAVDAVGLANANLFAAAPDLLAACRAALAFGSHGDTHEGLSVSELLRSAIRKAEGDA